MAFVERRLSALFAGQAVSRANEGDELRNESFVAETNRTREVAVLADQRGQHRSAPRLHDELTQQCDAVIVGDISASSMLALRLTALRPEKIHGLMLFSPTFWPNGWAVPWYFSLFRLVQQKWSARLFKFRARTPHGIKDDRLRSFILDSVQSETDSIEDLFARGGGLVLEFRRLVRNVKPLLGKITQHALVFHPRNDDQSDLSNAMTLQRKLSGIVETCVLDDCYHMVTLDRQRPIVMDRVKEFAERLTARLDKLRTEEAAVAASEAPQQSKGGRSENRGTPA